MGGGEGFLIAAESVVQQCGHVVGETDGSSQTPGCPLLDAGLDHLQRRGLRAAPRGQQKRGVPEGRVASCLADRVSLLEERRRRAELSGEHMHAGAVRQRAGKDCKRAGIATDPDRASGQLMPRLVVPQVGR